MNKNTYTLGHYSYWPTTGIVGLDTVLDNLVNQAFPDLKKDWAVAFEGTAFPRVNVTEDDNNVYIEADVHGYEKESVKVEYDKKKNILTIAGDSANSKEKSDIKYLKREIKRGSFSRSFMLNKDIVGEDISVDYNNGTINITIPRAKKEEAVLRLL